MTPAEPSGQRDRAAELAEAEAGLRSIARTDAVIGDDVALVMEEYDRRVECLRFLNEKYDIRREQQQHQDKAAAKLRAALDRQKAVVEAARALVAEEGSRDQWEIAHRFWDQFDVLAREVHALDSDGGGDDA